ncbi:erythromycin esterase family protein [Hymenobacter sp. BT175]|uniref:erythromycin esterase family protein n=1 Tax=Hymenobacter translucens TaxID=2886507 RepID=UPI001D0E0263|nr:erythromycin esterase family protein [Hymenobacter translucens]MCC2547742.1 erythromycin esterase family protein [Hymenobacter translucens]
MKTIRLTLLLALSWCLSTCGDKDPAKPATNRISLPATGVSRLETAQDLDPLLSRLGTARYALLGEASHGTSEFYTWRATLSKRLIQEKGFTMIAVEGDWPALYELNRYVKGNSPATSAAQVLSSFGRWPTWLWANQEVAELAEWLRTYNQTQPVARKVGFYGLDLYSLWPSLESIRTGFAEADPATRNAVDAALQCLQPYNGSEEAYGRATLQGASCANELNAVLAAVRNRMRSLPAGHEAAFNAEQNALVAVNAERYYRTAFQSSSASWNVRDRHMMETINRLMSFHGGARIIVWEHNTHVGDARYTDMAQRGEVNVGQLTREQHAAEGVFIVGFGTYQGTVTASPFWGGPATVMQVPAAPAGSWEATLHEAEPRNKLILLQDWRSEEKLTQTRGHRAIGVVYDPGRESGNYVPTNLPQRYDAFLFIDQTQALRPLGPGSGGVVAEPTSPGQLLTIRNF